LYLLLPPLPALLADIRKIVEAATQNNYSDMNMQGMDQYL